MSDLTEYAELERAIIAEAIDNTGDGSYIDKMFAYLTCAAPLCTVAITTFVTALAKR